MWDDDARIPLLVAVVLLAAIATSSSDAAGTARWQPREAETKVMAAVWADHRIVIGATCLGLDPILRGREQVSSRFSCGLQVWLRPARVSLARWDEMGAAFRKRDVQTIYRLLGVSAGATPTEVEAAAQRWGLANPRAMASGLQVLFDELEDDTPCDPGNRVQPRGRGAAATVQRDPGGRGVLRRQSDLMRE
ncbi:MAG: hypothetical protein ACR2GT_09475 [Gaiellaceae bacterium]